MNSTALDLLRGLVRSLELPAVSFSLHVVHERDPETAGMMLTWAARSVRRVWLNGPREAEPLADSAYLLALALRDSIQRPGKHAEHELHQAILQARLAIAPFPELAS